MRTKSHPGRTSLLVVLLAVATCLAGGATASAQSNPIQIENAKEGSTDWLLTRVVRHDDEIYELGWRRRRGIEAYASQTSIRAGETLDVHVPDGRRVRWRTPDGARGRALVPIADVLNVPIIAHHP